MEPKNLPIEEYNDKLHELWRAAKEALRQLFIFDVTNEIDVPHIISFEFYKSPDGTVFFQGSDTVKRLGKMVPYREEDRKWKVNRIDGTQAEASYGT
jgi:hypothetical protein